MYEDRNDDRIVGPIIESLLYPGPYYRRRYYDPYDQYYPYPYRRYPYYGPRRRRRYRRPRYYY